MPGAHKITFWGLSIALHVLVIGAFVVAEQRHTNLNALWQGGGAGRERNAGRAGVVLIDLTTLNLPSIEQSTVTTSTEPVISKTAATKNLPKTKKIPTGNTVLSSASGAGTGVGTNSGAGVGNGLDALGADAPNVLAKIRKKIFAAKTYPQSARDAGESGKVKVSFLISPDGTLASAAVIGSSGFARLDSAALGTLKRAVPLPFYPQPIVLTLEYRLESEEGLTW